jgi:cbb3-type cytochrome oxidase subunit 3
MLYTSAAFGMAGCCEGRDTRNCGWAHSCVDYSNYVSGNCGSNCILDTFVRKCTDIASPYCVTWTYPSDGIADYGCDTTSTNTVFTVRQTARDGSGGTTSTRLPTVAAAALTIPTGTSNDTTTRKTVKKIAIGTIIGIVVAALFIIFFIIIGVVMFMKKKKKQQQLAANAQIVANAQANRPQSQYQPPPPPQMQQGPPPPMPTQSPQPTINGTLRLPASKNKSTMRTLLFMSTLLRRFQIHLRLLLCMRNLCMDLRWHHLCRSNRLDNINRLPMVHTKSLHPICLGRLLNNRLFPQYNSIRVRQLEHTRWMQLVWRIRPGRRGQCTS